MSSFYGSFEPEHSEASRPETPLVISQSLQAVAHSLPCSDGPSTPRRRWTKMIGGLLLGCAAVAAVVRGRSALHIRQSDTKAGHEATTGFWQRQRSAEGTETIDSDVHSCGKGCTEDDDDFYNPTALPSTIPTMNPTLEPTTSKPTLQPTTGGPTSEPTTRSPTAEPTAEPTAAAPTTEPTSGPTPEPTNSFKPTTYYELESEYDDDNLYRLVCADFDDDGVYPSHFCNYGDSKTCVEKVTTSDNYDLFCGSTCNEYEMRKVENGNSKTSEYSNSSWAVVCGWEAIKHMNETCDGTFEPSLEEDVSADAFPNYTYSTAPKDQEVNGEKYDACNLHAFCSVCSYDGGTKIHRNCKAHVDKYGTGAIYEVTSFFNSLDSFWCTDDVQDAIADGTFQKKYGR